MGFNFNVYVTVYRNNAIITSQDFSSFDAAHAWVWACKKTNRYGDGVVYSLPYVY
jgi:hypothetical protein